MKIIRNADISEISDNGHPAQRQADETMRYAWKILVVDDEPDIRTLTRISLRDFTFANRSLEFIEAGSAAEAMTCLNYSMILLWRWLTW